MEADTAFVRTDSVVVLYTIASVYLYFAFVVSPCDTELDNSVRDTETLNQIDCLKLWVLVVHILNRFQYCRYSLKVFGLIGEFFLQSCNNFFSFHLRFD